MQVFTRMSLAEELARATGKWVLYLVPADVRNRKELISYAPYLAEARFSMVDLILTQFGLIVCDSKEQCFTLFQQTQHPPVDACVISPEGELITGK